VSDLIFQRQGVGRRVTNQTEVHIANNNDLREVIVGKMISKTPEGKEGEVT